MNTKLKIGIIKEGKVPQDKRVALIPEHAAQLQLNYPGLEIVVQPSDFRCFSDQEYLQHGVKIQEDLEDCDILLGVKEVPIKDLIPNKTYLFFSHTIKKQPHNRKLLVALLNSNIRMVDYETLTFNNGKRAVAFGHFAGIVGAHNGLKAYGQRTNAFSLKAAYECEDYAELRSLYPSIDFPPMRIVVAGTGRVGSGAVELLNNAGFRRVDTKEYLKEKFTEPVYVELRSKDLFKSKSGKDWDSDDFHHNPSDYRSRFMKYAEVTDLFINTIFWDIRTPRHFSIEDMRSKNFAIKTIADISCDIMGSVPATVRASSIDDPVYGFDPFLEREVPPYSHTSIDIMAVDNLPCELPRDASHEFSHNLIRYVIPELLDLEKPGDMIVRATITDKGTLCKSYEYLSDYAGLIV